MVRMPFRCCRYAAQLAALCLLLAPMPAILPGQAVPVGATLPEANLASTLKDKPLYLRGRWSEDNLHFDGNGNLLSKSVQTSFTLSGVRVDSIKRKDGLLELKAHRVGVELVQDLPRRVRLDEQITIDVEVPVSGDFGTAMVAIFTPNLEDLLTDLPEAWQPFAAKYQHAGAKPYVQSARWTEAKEISKGLPQRMGSPSAVSFPKLIKQVDPRFTNAARTVQYKGETSLSVLVGAGGLPVEVHIDQPIGLGLDDAAVTAVMGYRFRPAERDGVAVPVLMQVAVTFETH